MLLTAALCVLAFVPPAQVGHAASPESGDLGTQRKDYYGGNGLAKWCTITQHREPNVAGACFTLPPDTRSVDVTIADLSGLPVGATYIHYDEPGDLTARVFCGAAHIVIPAGVNDLQVWVGGVQTSGRFNDESVPSPSPEVACFPWPGQATAGTISVTSFANP